MLDIKPIIPPKRIKREIYRSNTCPNLNNKPSEKVESKSGQRKSKRLQRFNVSPSPPPSPEPTPPAVVTIKKEPITTMKRHVPSVTAKESSHPNQIIVKTDQRHYWCTKCGKVYLNLISLYTESHYRQCVGEDQRFNVIDDPAFFTNEDILQQLPSNASNDSSATSTADSTESSTNSRKKESIFFSKTSEDSRTYFINGKPIRMNTINRPVTVKDLRQQFQQQSSFSSSSNPSEEYIYQQRPTGASRSSRSNDNSNWSNESVVKAIPTPRSFDTFGISSDEEEPEKQEKKSPVKQEVEKTLVKRRYDSDYSSSTNTITSVGQDDDIDTPRQGKSTLTRKSQPTSTARVSQLICEIRLFMCILACFFFSDNYFSKTISFPNTIFNFYSTFMETK